MNVTRTTQSEVSITELRQNFSKYLARVRAGQTIRITSHGNVVAEIAQPRVAEDRVAAARSLLKDSVRGYDRPFDPVFDESDWDAHR